MFVNTLFDDSPNRKPIWTAKFTEKVATVCIWIAFALTILLGIIVVSADAHDLHLGELNVPGDMELRLGPLVSGPNWISGVGAVISTEGYNGGPNKWWVLYKGMDMNHSGVHAKPLSKRQAKALIMLQILKQH